MRDLTRLLPPQFRVLYRVFLLRVIDLELLSADSDTTKLVGQFAGMFATFSMVISLPFLLFGFPRTLPPTSWTMEHFLIATTMLVTGLFSVLTWDSIFPDRRDALVLGPLPVKAGMLFGAKLTALLAAVGLVVVSLNIVSGFTFPLMFFPVGSGVLGMLRCLVTYWITIALARAFLFSCVVAVQGCAAQVLPRQMFLRVSALLQVTLFCLFVATYFLEPPLESVQALAAPENQRWLRCLPAYWFLGLFHELEGSIDPTMVPLARRAWIALAAALAGSGAAAFLSYFRVMRAVVEEPDIVSRPRGRRWSAKPGGSLTAALLLFSTRALFRSRQHRVLLSFYLGVGVAIVLTYVRTPLTQRALTSSAHPEVVDPAFLAASVLMLLLSFFGLRVVSAIPVTLRANWIFQISQTRSARRYLDAVGTCWLLLGVAPVWLLSTLLLPGACPWRPAGKHAVLLALLGALLVEVSLLSFRKIPFTCSYLPGKGNLHLLFWVFLGLLLPMLGEASRLESQWLLRSSSFLGMVLGFVVLLAAARYARRRLSGRDEVLLFEDEEAPVLVSLKLG